MHSLRMHGDGIAECPTCGAIYRLRTEPAPGEPREAFDCQMCGDVLDTLVGHTRRAYELVALPDIGHAMTL